MLCQICARTLKTRAKVVWGRKWLSPSNWIWFTDYLVEKITWKILPTCQMVLFDQHFKYCQTNNTQNVMCEKKFLRLSNLLPKLLLKQTNKQCYVLWHHNYISLACKILQDVPKQKRIRSLSTPTLRLHLPDQESALLVLSLSPSLSIFFS